MAVWMGYRVVAVGVRCCGMQVWCADWWGVKMGVWEGWKAFVFNVFGKCSCPEMGLLWLWVTAPPSGGMWNFRRVDMVTLQWLSCWLAVAKLPPLFTLETTPSPSLQKYNLPSIYFNQTLCTVKGYGCLQTVWIWRKIIVVELFVSWKQKTLNLQNWPIQHDQLLLRPTRMH